MTAAFPNLPKTCAQQRRKHAAGRQLGEPRYDSGGDFDVDRHQRLSGRFLPLAPQRVDVELQCAASPINGLTPRSSVNVAARNLGDRGDEAPVGLALDGHDVSQLHVPLFGRRIRPRQRALLHGARAPAPSGRCMQVPPARFERTAPGLGILCSIHLSYGGVVMRSAT